MPAALEHDLRAADLILMSEIHGTAEAPAAFAAAVCAALSHGRAVSVGLELNDDQPVPLARYLASDGTDHAVAEFLDSPFWTRAFQDGRSSTAMLALVERLRQLRRRYSALSVFVLYGEAGTTPDARMAARVRVERIRRPQALILTLSGNVHGRLTVLPGAALPEPMGGRLLDLAPRAVLLDAQGGNAWMCMPNCTVGGLPARGGPAPHPEAQAPGGPYTFRWPLGPATASPPAVRPSPR